MFASRKRVTDISQPLLNVQAPPSASNQQKLELAKRLASKINMAKGAEAQDITQQTAAAILKGGMAAPVISVCTYHILNKLIDLDSIRDKLVFCYLFCFF